MLFGSPSPFRFFKLSHKRFPLHGVTDKLLKPSFHYKHFLAAHSGAIDFKFEWRRGNPEEDGVVIILC
jgi:hypothetical protein